MKLSEIVEMPTVRNNVHESVYRQYHVLEYVLKMVERGDSKKTILEVADLLSTFDQNARIEEMKSQIENINAGLIQPK